MNQENYDFENSAEDTRACSESQLKTDDLRESIGDLKILNTETWRYEKLVELFLDEYHNLKVRSKSAFCEKYNISRPTLRKYLKNYGSLSN